MTEKEAHITVRDLTMAYGDFVVMRDLNFTINRGDIFIIMGGSGCGKSTLLRMIGLKPPAKGAVLYGDVEFLGRGDPKDRRPDDAPLRHVLPERGPVELHDPGREHRAAAADSTPTWTRSRSGRCRLKLALVGLAGFEDYYPSEISGGMQKRAGLARAMALDPELLFFDEPSAGLDPISARLLDDLILELRDSLGTTVVVVTHELASIFAIGTTPSSWIPGGP